jgi:DNA repair exonuclease SbcCD ATPase subunit
LRRPARADQDALFSNCGLRLSILGGFFVEPGLRDYSAMDKETKKKLKRIQKEVKKLKKRFDKVEFRPCNCDAELRAKDEELKALRQRMNELERELDRCMLDSGGVRHGG